MNIQGLTVNDIQGLTVNKLVEVKDLVQSPNIIALTETHSKFDRFQLSKDFKKTEQFKSKNERKGGLMLLYKDDEKIGVEKLSTNHNDLLHDRIIVHGFLFHIIFVYFSVSDKETNNKIKTNIDEILRMTDDKPLILLSDFNDHLGFLGHQKLDQNGKFILEFMENFNLTFFNDVEECQGVYTWTNNNDMRSVIDYILIN